MKRYCATLLAIVALLGGCAHLPEATIGYYLPTSDVTFKVIRTIACDATNNPVVATAVTPSVRYFADKTNKASFIQIPLKPLRGTFADADVKFDYYETGTLAAVNATATGQGEAILKTAITLTAAAVKAGGVVALVKLSDDDCKKIKDFGGGKPLTVTYTGTLKFGDFDAPDKAAAAAVAAAIAARTDIPMVDNVSIELKPDPDSAFYVSSFPTVLLPITATVVSHSRPQKPVEYTPPGKDDVVLRLRQPGAVRIKLTVPGADKPIWDDELLVAALGTPYVLPVPRPVVFGKKTLAVSFAESGALKSVQFVSSTGSGQALNVASAGLTALQGDTAAQQAAEVKAEGDLIAAQQRLVACKADPTTCK